MGGQRGVGVDGSPTAGVDLEVQVARTAAGVARVADVADDLAGADVRPPLTPPSMLLRWA